MKQPKGTAISLAIACQALIKLGQMASDIRGSVGGTTFARNRHGAYARNRTKPVNVINDLTTASRNRFGGQAFGWTALTQAQRDVWNADAASVTLLNRLGEAYTPTGRQLFLTANNNLAQGGRPLLTDSPGNFVIPNVTFAALAVAGVAAGVTTIDTMTFTISEDTQMYIYAAPFTSGTRTNYQSLIRWIGFADETSSAPVDMKAAFVAKYGNVVTVGQTAVIQVAALNETNGMMSAKQQLSAIVTT